MARGRPLGRDELGRRKAQRVGAAGFLLAAALPVLLWRDLMATVFRDFRLDAEYVVSGMTPWVLMALGLACFLPVAFHEIRDHRRRFHTRGTAAWAGWGTTLYLLGFLLATQVSQIADGFSRG